MRILTHNEKETVAFAKKFARTLKGGETILLIGDLGAGKTTFTRALARALGIKAKIKSPTFTLMHVYRPKNKETKAPKNKRVPPFLRSSVLRYLVHCDAYRISRARDLAEIGLMDFIGRPDTVVVVEWGEKIKPLLKKIPTVSLTFSHGKTKNARTIVMSSRP